MYGGFDENIGGEPSLTTKYNRDILIISVEGTAQWLI